MARRILCLDIRRDGLAAALINTSIKNIQIESFKHVPADPAGLDLLRALQTVRDEMNFAGAACIASLSADLVLFRNFRAPFKEPKKISQILPFEIETALPLPVDELVIDFKVLRNSRNPELTEVFVAAVEQSDLRAHLEDLAQFQLNPEIITLSGYSVAAVLAGYADMPQQWVLAEADLQRCNVYAVVQKEICFARSFVLRPETLVQDLRCTFLSAGHTLEIDFSPEGIWFSGDSATLLESLQHGFDIPVKALNILKTVSLKEKIQTAETPVPASLSNGAYGLGLCDVIGAKIPNFRKGAFAPKRRWLEHKGRLIQSAALAAALLVILLLNGFLKSSAMEQQIHQIDRQITEVFHAALPEVKKIVDPVHQLKTSLADLRKNELGAVGSNQPIRAVDILNTVSKVIPQNINVTFDTLLIGTDSVLINGDTDTFNSVDEIKGILEKTSLFNKVTISSANLEKSDNRVRFKIRANL